MARKRRGALLVCSETVTGEGGGSFPNVEDVRKRGRASLVSRFRTVGSFGNGAGRSGGPFPNVLDVRKRGRESRWRPAGHQRATSTRPASHQPATILKKSAEGRPGRVFFPMGVVGATIQQPKVITLWKNSNQFNPEAEVTETSPPGRSRRADSDFAIRLPPNPLETSIFEKWRRLWRAFLSLSSFSSFSTLLNFLSFFPTFLENFLNFSNLSGTVFVETPPRMDAPR